MTANEEPRPAHSQDHEEPYPSPTYAWYVVGVLMLIYVLNFVDRQILSLIVDPVKKDLNASLSAIDHSFLWYFRDPQTGAVGVNDTAMGLLTGTAFGLFYSFLGVPFGWLADRRSRRGIVAGGVATWSFLTAACGIVGHYWQLFLLRMGVGVGEATLSPAAYSIIADYFPRHRLATAISVYGMGIYIGSGMAYLLGGLVIKYAMTGPSPVLPLVGAIHPWQMVFLSVGAPGLLFALLVFTVREPIRRGVGGKSGHVSFAAFLRYAWKNGAALIPHHLGFAMIAFMGYAGAAWIPTFFARIHEWDRPTIGLWYGSISILFGSSGIVFGGWLADRLSRMGFRDSKMRCGFFSAVLCVVFGFLYPMIENGTYAMLILGPMTFAQAMSFGVAPAAVQEMMPANMRGQGGAMYLLIINFIAMGFAAPTVGALNDYLFHDVNAIGKSLIIVNVASCSIAAVLLILGLKPFVRSLDRLKEWGKA